jgi:glucose/arabinose dehydrogenase
MKRIPLLLLAGAAACSSTDPALGGGPPPSLAISDVATGLAQPSDVAFLPDGRMVVIEKGGAVRLRATDGTLSTAGTFPVDTRSEKGLLGVAVDPGFAATSRLFFYYSLSDAAGGNDVDRHRVVSVSLRTDGTLDPATETVLVSGLRGPANHDGGALAVGPDGKLYVGVGDTGCNSGQPPELLYTPTNYFPTCLTNGNGKILRVNLDGSIPADNPLAAAALATACGATCGTAPSGLAVPRADVWAWGFRNPWRFSFDPQTGRLWVGDVGEVTYEEVTVAEAGRHHGWPWREGGRGWPVAKCRETTPDRGDCVEPAYFCRHGVAAGGVDGDCQSITGGVIVDGAPWPASEWGRYWFADNVNGRVWTLTLDATRTGVVSGSRREVAKVAGGPVSMRLGPDGAIYVAVISGKVVRIAPGP